ncbi:MAG TPA: discoidin domain-containing protein [Planctomycetota bacterium]|nr:discoidin domain-containing protein [Planctomycetota bacterium]
MRTSLRSVALLCGLGVLLASLAATATTGIADQVKAQVEAEWIAQDARFAPASAGASAARPTPGTGVTTKQDASGGVDGVKNGRWGFHTASGETDPWWQVDLGEVVKLDRVVVFNRTDRVSAARTRNIRVSVAGADGDPACKEFRQVYQHDGTVFGGAKEGKPLVVSFKGKEVAARVVRLHIQGKCSFALDEVEVYAADAPDKNIALKRPADQKSVGPYSYPGTLPEGQDTATAPAPPQAKPQGGGFSLAHTRYEVERAKKLAARILPIAQDRHRQDACATIQKALAELAGLEERLAVEETKGGTGSQPVARQLYLDARRIKRAIAFASPLLDFDKLLFITRHDAAGVFHMCDQFYGCNARPGGGLFVLHDPFGDSPKLVNLLENSTVEKGRLAGQKLVGGAFLSPELSFDGKTILFAYSQATAFAKSRGKETYLWGPEISYHIFKCNADPSGASGQAGLVQLTDGDPDDFDPCFLPSGRVAFVTERRGGYLRCGRHCPVYTIFSMEPDGSDIQPLSYHETHEWHPSVTNDGMLVYSRWDYVDRDTNIAHHIWLSYPDGRDPRAFHGNYPVRREARPWMEMNIRAIPGSHKFVAVTGAHHGHAYGSLVLIDHQLPDDQAMSQLERLTPDCPFPEAEGRPINKFMRYATPWPLSEDDYLAAYDADAKNRGIYWLDRLGNKELVYRDPAISCSDPIPLRPRPTPPLIPDETTQTARAKAAAGDRPATIAVMNVYDSDFEWPADAKVAALRVIQLLPKSTAPPNVPRVGCAQQTNARAVLGTVPVESDGSAFFEAPVGKPIYFQALDARGLAIQSMRSVTYVHPGERLTCQGCHERKNTTNPVGGASLPRVPLALRRGPSPIQPDVEGSNPFNYPRLVQPALDRACVACHREKKAVALDGAVAVQFTQSYNALAAKYGFYFHVTNGSFNSGVHGGSRTVAGQFGAKAAPLMKYLTEAHHGVKLSPEDFHRITLWLDCNSEFLGAYEDAPAQARGLLVRPALE